MLESERFKKFRKNRKCLVIIGINIVFNIVFTTIFSLTVMKVKTPSVQLRSVTVQNISGGSATLIAEVAVKNKNFGPYKFDGTTANVTYENAIVGTGDIIKSKAGMKKTKRMNVTIEVNSSGASDNVTLGAVSRVTGKVSLMGMIKKRKTINMNCSMILNVPNKIVYDLTCK